MTELQARFCDLPFTVHGISLQEGNQRVARQDMLT